MSDELKPVATVGAHGLLSYSSAFDPLPYGSKLYDAGTVASLQAQLAQAREQVADLNETNEILRVIRQDIEDRMIQANLNNTNTVMELRQELTQLRERLASSEACAEQLRDDSVCINWLWEQQSKGFHFSGIPTKKNILEKAVKPPKAEPEL